MWNPFRSVRLTAVVPSQDIKPAIGDPIDPDQLVDYERSKMRSLLARTQISMIHETLAVRALSHIRGGNSCPD